MKPHARGVSESFTPFLWSLFVAGLVPLIHAVALCSAKIRRQSQGRRLDPEKLRVWKSLRDKKSGCVVFFCSSGGEYEQAKPLIDRLERDHPQVMPFVFFFSTSGSNFARSRQETAAWSLSPWDTIWSWRLLFAALRPSAFIVVRYELWPAFLAEARRHGPLILVNATRNSSAIGNPLARLIRSILMQRFAHVFTVGPADQAFAISALNVPPGAITVCGDTKYDRVRERSQSKARDIDRLTSRLNRVLGTSRRLIVGSAWPKDAELALAAFRIVRMRDDGWQLILAPHDVSAPMIGLMSGLCARYGMAFNCLSQWIGDDNQGPLNPRPDVLIADTMGMLSELYGTAQLAFVGGALHFRVHNVLEPACHGLPLAFGPLHKTSAEAVHFVDKNLATVLSDASGLADWWIARGINQNRDAALLAEVDRMCGAADRIMTYLDEALSGFTPDGGIK